MLEAGTLFLYLLQTTSNDCDLVHKERAPLTFIERIFSEVWKRFAQAIEQHLSKLAALGGTIHDSKGATFRLGGGFTNLLFQQLRKSLTKTRVHALHIVLDVPNL